jgi:hypothetical protein
MHRCREYRSSRTGFERFAHREKGVEHQFLRYHPELSARSTIVGLDIVAHHAEAAGIGAHQPGQGGNQGGLAGAVGAEQAEELSLLDLQVDPSSARVLPKDLETC